MHGCAIPRDGTSSTLSMSHWLNEVCHCQCHSNTLHCISSTLAYISLNQVSPFLRNYLSGSIYICSVLQQNFYHLFAPVFRWYVQRTGASLRNPTWSANAKAQNQDGQQTNDAQYSLLVLLSHIQETKTHHWQNQTMMHLPQRLRKHALSIGRICSCTNVPKDANCMSSVAK